MKMMGISKGILKKLYDNNIIKSIGDLYRLTPDMIMSVDGFKEKSANNIIKSIRKASENVSLDRWMGALPIKEISSKIWRTLIDAKYPMDEMKATCCYRERIENGTPNEFIEECIPIYVYGFSTKLYAAIKEGLFNHWDDIQDIIKYVTFKSTTNMRKSLKGRVTLTGTRDEKLISYLQEKGYEVSDFSSKTIALVIPYEGFVSSKVPKAIRNGIPVYTIEQAYEKLR
jgi:NAD-dependent DNA ligase